MLTLIALTKLAKTTLLIAAGVLALAAVKTNVLSTLAHWTDALSIGSTTRYLHRALGALSGMSTRKLEGIGAGTFAYAALFATEGLGLWFQKSWAEYFTIAITGSFVPLELLEIVRHDTAPRIITLVINLIALVYLVVRVVRKRSQKRLSAQPQPRTPYRPATS